MILLFIELKSDNARKYITFYFNSKVEWIVNENDIDDIFELIYITIISNKQKQKYLGKSSG